ncbi:MAG: hypothetical protein DWQ31_00395 [Planctomycetota bacterium]|nr:MAG: hypothetical protein DWQ31_00395 [Planctomycetota bacterium]REJ88322.1 MAG: hypothetical protein DWQ35_20325 [Planctomycetota bacterium]REK22969.1 MAG: hypothetical protein DWQ42_16230 [Planctomycetota bacterium]REK44771.1 MAG: hypothetical protein DWQ46_08640 [Planctomycetota bacterium]
MPRAQFDLRHLLLLMFVCSLAFGVLRTATAEVRALIVFSSLGYLPMWIIWSYLTTPRTSADFATQLSRHRRARPRQQLARRLLRERRQRRTLF